MNIQTGNKTILFTVQEQEAAARYISTAGEQLSNLQTPEAGQLPEELRAVVINVLKVIQQGSAITVSSVPREVTTTTAASMLGMSRPTLMKHVRNGRIDAHMVGSHHRLLTDDVLKFQAKLKEEKRRAVFGLMDLERELGEA